MRAFMPIHSGSYAPAVAVVAHQADGFGERGVVGGDQAAFTGDQQLGRRERENFGIAETADGLAAILAAKGVGAVEDQLEIVLLRDLASALRHRRDFRRGARSAVRVCAR